MDVGAALAEQRLLVLPLALDGLGGTEHQRRRAQTTHDLQSDDRLARAGRRHQERLAMARGAVGLERVEALPLVAAPGAGEGPGGEGGGHTSSVPGDGGARGSVATHFTEVPRALRTEAMFATVSEQLASIERS